MSLPDHLQAIEEERGRVYGDPQTSHQNIGLAWTGLLQQHYGIKLDHAIPDWMVALMMVQFKVQRSALAFKQDNFDDAKVYLDFSERFQAPKTETIPLNDVDVRDVEVMIQLGNIVNVGPTDWKWMENNRTLWSPKVMRVRGSNPSQEKSSGTT